MSSDHAEHEAHDHVPTYVKLAIVLGIITALEVGILELKFLSDALALFGLYALSALKFGYVVAVFMHLKYDNKALTGIFFGGFTVALATMFAVVALISYQPSKTAINVKDSVELAALNAGNPENGSAVFMAKGCAACHAISSLPGAAGAVGPKLDGLGQVAASRVSGLAADAYIRQSIEQPNAYVVEGYAQGLMPSNLKGSMTDEEYKDLIAYLGSL
ncbi:MAG: c-type cytochrome [Candidatus Sericytochromatia bacterium]|nr:c-type cytochrome [Candidatus Sericytochromatia bacterium]